VAGKAYIVRLFQSQLLAGLPGALTAI
jgi:hypothetical protein